MGIISITPEELAWMAEDYRKEVQQIVDGIVFDEYGVTIKWRCDYEIEWSRLGTPLDLLGWVQHLSRKNWVDMLRIRVFIDEVCKYKGWKVGI